MSKATKIHFIILYSLLALVILTSVAVDAFIFVMIEGLGQVVRQHSVVLKDNNLGTTRSQ